MNDRYIKCFLLSLVGLLAPAMVRAADDETFTRREDVIYGRKFGMALTMDVFTPKQKPNGAAIIWVTSGGWFSAREAINLQFLRPMLERGYTVFAVMHGSQPKYTIPEAIEDMNHSVRYIRAHAADFAVDPHRIGVSGGSAGGHLSLMMGTAGNEGDPKAKDPVDRTSSRVQAVACFFPPTDFLNYGTPGFAWLNRGPKDGFQAPFDFQVWNKELKRFDEVDEASRVKIAREVSPLYHVSADDPPTLIIHGDKDYLVPLQQSELIIGKLKEAGVPCELVVKKGEAHGWRDWHSDISAVATWFDKYLSSASTAQVQPPAPPGN
ncbi:MAG: alpha/beta hydrolase fold domain-containing protein [Pirellulales bacterium]